MTMILPSAADDHGPSPYIGSIPAFVYILSSFIANAGVSVTGFGMALIFVFVFTLFDVCGGVMTDCQPSELCDMKYAVFIQSLSLVGSIPFLIYKSNFVPADNEANGDEDRSIQRKRLLLSILIPVTLVSTPAGQMCQEYVSSSWIRMVVGVVVTLVVGFEIYKLFPRNTVVTSETHTKLSTNSSINNPVPTERSSLLIAQDSTESPTSNDNDNYLLHGFSNKTIILWGIVLGFFSGFLGGLIGMRGPPLMIFFLHFPFAKQEARAVGAIMLFINMALRILYYLLQDHYADNNNNNAGDNDPDKTTTTRWFYWNTSWHLYVGVITAGILGVPIGDWIHHHIDQSKFRLSLAVLLAASGVVNIMKATSELRQP